MKFNLHYSKYALNAVINISFPVSGINSSLLAGIKDEECSGCQSTMLLKSLFDNINIKVCSGVNRINNRIVSSNINIFGDKCTMVFVCGNNRTLVKKVVGLIFKSLQVHRLFPLYKINCSGCDNCKADRSEFTYLVNDLVSSLESMSVCIAGKLKYESDSAFQQLFKEIASSKLALEKIDDKGTKVTCNKSKPCEFEHVLKTSFIPQVFDFIITKTGAVRIGDRIIFCKEVDSKKLFDSSAVENFIKKYNKYGKAFQEVMIFDMLLNGVPHSLINNITMDSFKKSFTL